MSYFFQAASLSIRTRLGRGARSAVQDGPDGPHGIYRGWDMPALTGIRARRRTVVLFSVLLCVRHPDQTCSHLGGKCVKLPSFDKLWYICFETLIKKDCLFYLCSSCFFDWKGNPDILYHIINLSVENDTTVYACLEDGNERRFIGKA